MILMAIISFISRLINVKIVDSHDNWHFYCLWKMDLSDKAIQRLQMDKKIVSRDQCIFIANICKLPMNESNVQYTAYSISVRLIDWISHKQVKILKSSLSLHLCSNSLNEKNDTVEVQKT